MNPQKMQRWAHQRAPRAAQLPLDDRLREPTENPHLGNLCRAGDSRRHSDPPRQATASTKAIRSRPEERSRLGYSMLSIIAGAWYQRAAG